jgi:hypothetical protein
VRSGILADTCEPVSLTPAARAALILSMGEREMRNSLWTALLVLGVCMSMGAQAQTGAAVVGTAPGAAAVAQTVKVTATIAAIDRAKREITVKGPQGTEVVLFAGPEVGAASVDASA